jgi:oxygen-independent coproporphyrinogen-3 oxidase
MAFSPEHLSCYELTLEEGTPMGNAYRHGAFSFPAEEDLLHFFLATSELLEKAGFVHYEVSNFARGLEHASRHNRKYWDHTPYLGLGPSAHSFNGSTRWWNTRSVAAYLNALRSGNPPVEAKEILTPEQLRLEAWFLGLRTRKGIDIRGYSEKYGEDLFYRNPKTLKMLQEQGFLTVHEGHLRPTRAGMAIADRLALL